MISKMAPVRGLSAILVKNWDYVLRLRCILMGGG